MGIKTQVDHNVKLCRLHTSVNSYRTSVLWDPTDWKPWKCTITQALGLSRSTL